VPLSLAQSLPMTGAVVVCTPQDIALMDARRAVKPPMRWAQAFWMAPLRMQRVHT